MSSAHHSYFFVPSWDYPPPPKGPIKLGNIITSIEEPENPLYTAPYPSDKDVILSVKKSVEYSKQRLRVGKFSILTKFLSILGVGVDVGADWDWSNSETFTFSHLTTTCFIPDTPYIESCISAAPVSRFLQKSRYSKPVYIITGIKAVSGAKAKAARTRAVGGNVGIEVDGTVWSSGAVPVSGGPEIEVRSGAKEGIAWEESSDFVFAFQAVRVKVKKKTGEVKEAMKYSKGAMLDSGSEVKETNTEAPFCVDTIGNVAPGEMGIEWEELVEGEEIVVCGIPRKVLKDT